MLAAPEPTTLQSLELVVIGLLAGGLGGLLGVGGGLVMIPAMLLILGEPWGPDSFHLYKLASLSTAALLSLLSARQHYRSGAVVTPMLAGIAPLGVMGVILGVGLAGLFVQEQTHVLRRVFGLVMMLEVLRRWLLSRLSDRERIDRWPNRCPLATRRLLIGSVVGLPAGLLSGLLGIGGGIWVVPAQNIGLGIRLQNAIANSACTVLVLTIWGAISMSIALTRMPHLHARDGWWLTLFLAPGAMFGAWFGAAMTHRIPTDWLRLAYYALLVVAGGRLLLA